MPAAPIWHRFTVLVRVSLEAGPANQFLLSDTPDDRTRRSSTGDVRERELPPSEARENTSARIAGLTVSNLSIVNREGAGCQLHDRGVSSVIEHVRSNGPAASINASTALTSIISRLPKDHAGSTIR
ncbi:MAG: hypothetical protein R3C02_05600 [Planctomycetaceae bacterium]